LAIFRVAELYLKTLKKAKIVVSLGTYDRVLARARRFRMIKRLRRVRAVIRAAGSVQKNCVGSSLSMGQDGITMLEVYYQVPQPKQTRKVSYLIEAKCLSELLAQGLVVANDKDAKGVVRFSFTQEGLKRLRES
jgi:hypothetical protein